MKEEGNTFKIPKAIKKILLADEQAVVARVLAREEPISVGRGGVCDYNLEKSKQRVSGLC